MNVCCAPFYYCKNSDTKIFLHFIVCQPFPHAPTKNNQINGYRKSIATSRKVKRITNGYRQNTSRLYGCEFIMLLLSSFRPLPASKKRRTKSIKI